MLSSCRRGKYSFFFFFFFTSWSIFCVSPQQTIHCNTVLLGQNLAGYLIIILGWEMLYGSFWEIIFTFFVVCIHLFSTFLMQSQQLLELILENGAIPGFGSYLYRFSFTFTNNDLFKVTKTAIASMLGFIISKINRQVIKCSWED